MKKIDCSEYLEDVSLEEAVRAWSHKEVIIAYHISSDTMILIEVNDAHSGITFYGFAPLRGRIFNSLFSLKHCNKDPKDSIISANNFIKSGSNYNNTSRGLGVYKNVKELAETS